MGFWEYYKKEIGITEITKKKVIIFLIVLILIGTGIWWSQHQKTVNLCKERCRYEKILRQDKYIWGYYSENRFSIFPTRTFETQEQCINYCLTVK